MSDAHAFAKGNTSATRVLDGWSAACRSDELGTAPLARTVLDVPIVLFRDAGGRAAALLDRCAHRNAPLSHGAVDEAGHLACPYHGWRFEGGGACRQVPGLLGDDDGGEGRDVPAFATVEQDGFVWTWAHTILGQDVAILRLQTERILSLGGESYRSTALDLMGPEILRMLRQAERGLPTDGVPIDRTITLRVF